MSRFKSADIKQSFHLCGEALGLGFMSENELKEFTQGDSKFGLVVREGDDLLGICLFARGTFEDILPCILENRDWFRDEFGKQDKMGFRKTTIVKASVRGRGIGKMLVTASMDELNKADLVLSVVWQKDKNRITKLLQAEGFEILKPIQHYWHHDSLEKGYECPGCGGPPCKCEAHVFKKENR